MKLNVRRKTKTKNLSIDMLWWPRRNDWDDKPAG